MNIGASLKRIRFYKKMKQKDVCKKAKLSQTYLSQLEGGVKEPSIPMLKKISKVYGVPVSCILFMSMEESDVQKGKTELFRSLKRVADDLIEQVYISG